ncbi:MAG TPA: TolC family protein [Vicinamibacterales bacterium]|nr:TolC family protein [Vicinamibacterales bacterium]
MKTFASSVRVFSCVLALIAYGAPAGAQNDADRVRLDEIAREAAREFAAANSATLDQTRPTAPAPPTGTTVELTLDEATARALERNLDIAVERLNPQTFDLNIARIRAAYRPTATSTIGRLSRVQAPTSTLNGGTIVDNTTTTYNSGLSQLVPWGGGAVAFQFNNNKQVTSNNLVNYNPAFNNNFALTLTQPLLRGFLIDNNRQQLVVTALNRDASEIQLRGTIATTLANVRNAYWELLFSIQALDVARGSLDLATKLVADNRARVEVGALAPLDVVQAQAEEATRRQALAQAEAQARTAELALKRLIVSGTDDPLWNVELNPVDRPTYLPEPLDVQGAVRKALDNRTDIQIARKTIDSNDVTLRFMRNQTLPELDLTAMYGATGLGGTQFQRNGTGVTSQVIGVVPGGYGDAWRTLTGRNYPTWNLALNLSYPLGASAQDAQLARAKVQLNQSAAQLRALELQVATDVTNAALQVQSGLTRYQAATVARDLAQQRLDAEQSRFEVGLSTNFLVVQAQRDLATAQNTELRALLDYRKALVDYERLQETPAARGGGITTINAAAGGGGVAAQGGN